MVVETHKRQAMAIVLVAQLRIWKTRITAWRAIESPEPPMTKVIMVGRGHYVVTHASVTRQSKL